MLYIEDNAALIITEDIIEQRPYHDDYKDIKWAECGLRKYLNGEFYDKFNDTDKSRIIEVTNKNLDNPWYGTKGGDDTKDSIFLLGIEDVVCRYFGDSSKKLQNRSKKQNYWFQRKDENNNKRIAKFMDYDYWWWLRSPGRINRVAAYVHGNPGGCVGINGNSVFFRSFGAERDGGVRPALWLKREL
ncbi:DUF6273 domain-containing protein [Clostridium sartagoforme]|uniref:DUF6273 domain-containing protein n=1 Tax=Clostridium sartagoforme TaxID=84031 RepID=UPI0031E2EE8A